MDMLESPIGSGTSELAVPWMAYERELSNQEVGKRLRNARIVANKSRVEAAEILGADEAVVIAVEDGRLHIPASEIGKLALRYGTCTSSILRKVAVHIDLVSRFRTPEFRQYVDIEAVARTLNNFVTAEMEFEQVLGMKIERRSPPEAPISTDDNRAISDMAESTARKMRNHLGLGSGSVDDLAELIEGRLGIRVYPHHLDSPISCLYAFDDRAGACMLLNSSLSREIFVIAAANGLGHFMFSRRKPFAMTADGSTTFPKGRFIDRFSECFLLPPTVAQRRFGGISEIPQTLIDQLNGLVRDFGVVAEQMTQCLEEHGILRVGAWEKAMAKDEFAANFHRPDAYRQSPTHRAKALLPSKLVRLARNVAKLDIYSEMVLANMLDLHLIDLRGLIHKVVNGIMVDCGIVDE